MLRFHGYRYAKMPDEPKPVPAAPVPAKETISAPEKQKREKKRKKRRAEKRETSVTSSSSDSSESENDERTKKLAALQEQVRDYLINREFVTALTVSLLCLVAKESFRYWKIKMLLAVAPFTELFLQYKIFRPYFMSIVKSTRYPCSNFQF